MNQQEKELRKAIRRTLETMQARLDNGREAFITDIMDQFCKSRQEAEKVFIIYRKARAIRPDKSSGHWNLTHGAFWELDAINNAINMPE